MKELNHAEALDIINGNGTILFVTEDCKVCKKLIQELTGCVSYGYYVTSGDDYIAKRLLIKSVPTVIQFKNGNKNRSFVGLFATQNYINLDLN